MNKYYTLFSTFLLAFIFSLLPTEAASHKKSLSRHLKCQIRNSAQCKDPDYFLKEDKMGCAKKSGNCRHKFCKAHCLVPPGNLYEMCLEHCTHAKTLARFSTKTRAKMYDIYFRSTEPSEGLSTKERHAILKNNVMVASMAVNLENAVQKSMSSLALYRHKRKNIDLSNQLFKQYQEAISQLSPREVEKLEKRKRKSHLSRVPD